MASATCAIQIAAFGMAGITIEDVDACEIYDCFTYALELTLQDYGFFGPGEGEDWFRGGTIPGITVSLCSRLLLSGSASNSLRL